MHPEAFAVQIRSNSSFLSWITAVLLFGCTHHPAAGPPRAALPLPAEISAYYAKPHGAQVIRPYGTEKRPALLRDEDFTRRIYELRYDEEGVSHAMRFEHYVPEPPPTAPVPAIVISEYLAGRVPQFAAEWFLDEGWQVLVIQWPRHMLDPKQSPAELEQAFRRLIKSARLTIDWLVRREQVDPARIGSFGVSFGGIINTCLAAVDRWPNGAPRLAASAIAMAGEGMEDILLRSTERQVVEYREERMQLTGQTLAEIEESARGVFRSDPAGIAQYIDPADVLLFLASFDSVVPIENGEQLWENLGRPDMYIAPTGHYSFILTMLPFPWLGSRLTDFFHARFDHPD